MRCGRTGWRRCGRRRYHRNRVWRGRGIITTASRQQGNGHHGQKQDCYESNALHFHLPPTTSARKEPRLRLPWCQSVCASRPNVLHSAYRLQRKPAFLSYRSALHKSYKAQGEPNKAIACGSGTEPERARAQRNTSALPSQRIGAHAISRVETGVGHSQRSLGWYISASRITPTYTTDEGSLHLVPFLSATPRSRFFFKPSKPFHRFFIISLYP